MAIKINWQDLLKRYINWQEIVRVYKNGGQIRPETVPPVFNDYLCFTAEESNSTVTLNKEWNPTAVSLEISYNKTTWTDYSIWTEITLANVGDKVYMRNKSETPTGFSRGIGRYLFSLGGEIAASGDITSLLCKNWTIVLQSERCFSGLFRNCTSLVSAPKLPATTLTTSCYSFMFDGCTSLVTPPPQLPATTLTENCYMSMFGFCSSLVSAPQIAATTLAANCCDSMFLYCESLVSAPQLLATTMESWGYHYMFTNCTSLTTIPQLPATTLAESCYEGMFGWCTSIKLSETQTWEYQTPYRIPSSWTWVDASNSMNFMFDYTWWTFKGTPSINTTYYTSNQVI